MPSQQSKMWCFTLNNYTDDHLAWINLNAALFQFIMYGKEVAPTTLTPHLQGFLVLNSRKTLSSVKDMFPAIFNGIHLEKCNGSFLQNYEYCSKDKEVTEYGEKPKQGKRTDLDVVCEAITSGEVANMVDLAEQFPAQFVKFERGFHSLLQVRTKPRNFKTEVIWCWGPTGSGKSRWAWETFPEAYAKDSTNKWWCGYHGQEAVILDDYRPSRELPFNYMLGLMDRYPFTVEPKGGHSQFVSKTIIVTSPFSPEQTLANLEWVGVEKTAQFLRRIDRIIEFPQLGTTTTAQLTT